MARSMTTIQVSQLNQGDHTIVSGIVAAREGRYMDALKTFQAYIQVHGDLANNSLAMSYYGLCLAVIKRKYTEASTICLKAIKRNTKSPEAYLNIAKILSLQNQKNLAVKAIKKGLTLNKTHPALITELRKIGLRKDPVLTSLGRSNPLNVFLGRIRAALT